MIFDARADRSLIRAGTHSNRYVLASITAPASRQERTRLPVNLALVLDRSGSMGGPSSPWRARRRSRRSAP